MHWKNTTAHDLCRCMDSKSVRIEFSVYIWYTRAYVYVRPGVWNTKVMIGGCGNILVQDGTPECSRTRLQTITGPKKIEYLAPTNWNRQFGTKQKKYIKISIWQHHFVYMQSQKGTYTMTSFSPPCLVSRPPHPIGLTYALSRASYWQTSFILFNSIISIFGAKLSASVSITHGIQEITTIILFMIKCMCLSPISDLM